MFCALSLKHQVQEPTKKLAYSWKRFKFSLLTPLVYFSYWKMAVCKFFFIATRLMLLRRLALVPMIDVCFDHGSAIACLAAVKGVHDTMILAHFLLGCLVKVIVVPWYFFTSGCS